MVKPMSPDEAQNAYIEAVPDVYTSVFNEILSESGCDNSIHILFGEVKTRLKKLGVNENRYMLEIIEKVLSKFKAEGWHVVRESPKPEAEYFDTSWTFIKA